MHNNNLPYCWYNHRYTKGQCLAWPVRSRQTWRQCWHYRWGRRNMPQGIPLPSLCSWPVDNKLVNLNCTDTHMPARTHARTHIHTHTHYTHYKHTTHITNTRTHTLHTNNYRHTTDTHTHYRHTQTQTHTTDTHTHARAHTHTHTTHTLQTHTQTHTGHTHIIWSGYISTDIHGVVGQVTISTTATKWLAK